MIKPRIGVHGLANPRASARPTELAQAQSLVAGGMLDEAQVLLERHLHSVPESAAGHHLMAIVAVMQRRSAPAIEHAERAVRSTPSEPQFHFALGRAHKLEGNLPRAIDAYQRAIQLNGNFAEAHVSLGIALKHSGDLQAAIDSYRRAIEVSPGLGVAHGNLGIALAAQAERAAKSAFVELPTDELLRSMERALQLESGNALLHRNYGALLMQTGRHQEAADALNMALGIAPADIECCLRLGECLRKMGHARVAIELYERWLARCPPQAPVMRALADTLTPAGRVDEALDWAEKAIAMDADAAAHLQLAVVYQQTRRIGEAVALARRATEMIDGQPDYHPVALLTSNYFYEDPEPIFELHAKFGKVLAGYAQPALRQFAGLALPELSPGQRIKLGYVSGDFMSHSVSYFVNALLEFHDRSRFEVVCYHNRAWSDAVTDRLRALGHVWVECANMTDIQLGRRIREDGVHILIDLAGHTSDSRVNAFALRPAPVQISYLGYPTISGVPSIDFRISDDVIDPGDMPASDAERPLCLPRSMFCYRPPSAPAIDAPPATRNGFVTFGSFNNVAKLSDHTLQLWSQVLQAVPHSQLLLKATTMTAKATRDNIVAFMSAQGISQARLRLVGRVDDRDGHLALYNQVDVALDPFPYNGATTTCEALWMGVPVISRSGRTHASRMGTSILNAAGHPEWAVGADVAYVATAARVAMDVNLLARWRAEARTHLMSSALLDGPGFTRCFEACLERAWAASDAARLRAG